MAIRCFLFVFWICFDLFIYVIAEREDPIRLRAFGLFLALMGLFGFCVRLTLKISFALISLYIFVFSTFKYVSVHDVNKIGGMGFSEVYPKCFRIFKSFFSRLCIKNTLLSKKKNCLDCLRRHIFYPNFSYMYYC